jgi:hypothetical protein
MISHILEIQKEKELRNNKNICGKIFVLHQGSSGDEYEPQGGK